MFSTPMPHSAPTCHEANAPRASDVSNGASPIVRPRRSPRLRIGFITPCLAIGGVEHWLLGLVKYSQQELAWSVVVTSAQLVEPCMQATLDPFARVMIGEQHLPAMLKSVDVVIAWGVHGLHRMIGGFDGPIVQVSHGMGAWTESFLESNRGVSSYCVAVSRAAATAFRHSDVTVILNGVDRERCLPLRPRDVVRQEWGLAPTEVAVGFVGRLSPEKNPLAASEAVRALGAGYRAVYVGKGYGVDMRPAARDISPSAIFVPPMHQIGDAMNALDCMIMASPAEGFSLALVECLVAGLPLVTTEVGGVPDLRREHEISFVTVPINPTPEELARAVRQAIRPAQRPLIESARAIALGSYTAEVMTRKWVDYLRAIA